MQRPGEDPSQIEYSFEEGVEETCRRVEELLKERAYAVVAIIGAAADVGKTTVSNSIAHTLQERGIAVASETRISQMGDPYFMSPPNPRGGVLLLNAEFPPYEGKAQQDEDLARTAFDLGEPFDKIDIRVYIYKNTPFPPDELQYADIVIRNPKATDKPRDPRQQPLPGTNSADLERWKMMYEEGERVFAKSFHQTANGFRNSLGHEINIVETAPGHYAIQIDEPLKDLHEYSATHKESILAKGSDNKYELMEALRVVLLELGHRIN